MTAAEAFARDLGRLLAGQVDEGLALVAMPERMRAAVILCDAVVEASMASLAKGDGVDFAALPPQTQQRWRDALLVQLGKRAVQP